VQTSTPRRAIPTALGQRSRLSPMGAEQARETMRIDAASPDKSASRS
jgi:hypothetical protein